MSWIQQQQTIYDMAFWFRILCESVFDLCSVFGFCLFVIALICEYIVHTKQFPFAIGDEAANISPRLIL